MNKKRTQRKKKITLIVWANSSVMSAISLLERPLTSEALSLSQVAHFWLNSSNPLSSSNFLKIKTKFAKQELPRLRQVVTMHLPSEIIILSNSLDENVQSFVANIASFSKLTKLHQESSLVS